jgi:hypothetical protein
LVPCAGRRCAVFVRSFARIGPLLAAAALRRAAAGQLPFLSARRRAELAARAALARPSGPASASPAVGAPEPVQLSLF